MCGTAFNEEFSRTRRENIAIVMHTAINLLNNENTFKASMCRKIKMAKRHVDL